MNSYFIEITQEAREDLEKIYYYLAYSQELPRTADETWSKIFTKIESLQEFPKRYPLVVREPERSLGMRILDIGNYSVLYSVTETTVIVKNIVYSSSEHISKLRGFL